MPDTSEPTRSLYSSTTWARSASRTFCTMTCFAVWAAMRPKATDSIGTSTKPPISAFGFHVHGIVEAQLALRELEFGGVVGEDLPAAERLVLAGLAVDLDAHVDVVAVLAPRRGCKRRLERLEDDLACDALLVGDGLDDFQDLLVHDQPTNRALLIPASGSFQSLRSTSIVTIAALDRPEPAAKPAPALDRRRQLDARLAAREPREVRRGPQRPVKPGRGDLEPVLAPDRILGIEHRADRAARPLAVVEPDPGAVGAVDVDPHQRIARRRNSTRPRAARSRAPPPPAPAGRTASPSSGLRPPRKQKMGTRPISGDPIGNKKAPRGGLPIDHSVPGDHDRASLPGPRWLDAQPPAGADDTAGRPVALNPRAAGGRSAPAALDSREPAEDA